MTAYRSFHGSNSGSGTMTGENRRWAAEPGIPGVVRFFAPFPYRSPFFTRNPDEEVSRALQHVETVITYEDPSRIGALLIEPVVGSNGVIVYPEGYLAGLREICNRYGIALIFDEVMTGFGRTGAAFATHRFGVQPDAIIFAKGVTSAYVPLGGVMLREELARYFDDHMMWAGHTYSGHPLSVAAGVATVDTYRDERIFERAAGLESTIRSGLESIAKSHPIVGEVRGVGALFALELVMDRESREPLIPWQGAGMGPLPTFLNGLRARGAYAFGRYNCIVISPPLTIEKSDLDQGFAALDGALGDLEKAVASGS
jgi:taurine--2-oxoglutarate transaminase